MPKLPLLSGEEIVKALRRSEKLAYCGIGKNHAVFKMIDQPFNISIPMHREVSRFLLNDQLKLAGISKDEFLRLLKRRR